MTDPRHQPRAAGPLLGQRIRLPVQPCYFNRPTPATSLRKKGQVPGEFFSRFTSGDLHSDGYIPARREWPGEWNRSASRLSTDDGIVGLATAHFYSLRVTSSHSTSFENSNLEGEPFLTHVRVYAPQSVVYPATPASLATFWPCPNAPLRSSVNLCLK